MPEGTKVHDTYEALLRKGYDKGKSARIAQAQTGQSLQTGKRLKKKKYNSNGTNFNQIFK